MPSGIPPDVTSLGLKINAQIQDTIDYFEIPALHEVTTSFSIAWKDCSLAFHSTSRFLRITFRPLFILLGLLSRYVYIVLQIIAKHTVHHAFIVLKETLYQLKIGSKEFIRFQRSLPKFWIGVELLIFALLVSGYLLRRMIKRRKYVERVTSWYMGKKRKILKKYYDTVQRISKTSMTLALLLPHILFIVVCVLVKYFLPSVIRFISSKTYTTDIISLWYPVYKTVGLLSFKKKSMKQIEKNHPAEERKDAVKPIKEKSSGKVTDRWINATAKKSSSINVNLPAPSTSTTEVKKVNGGGVADRWLNATSSTPVIVKASTSSNPVTRTDFDQESSLLLRYWIVYGFTFSLLRFCFLLPFVGSYLSNTATQTAGSSIISNSSTPGKFFAFLIPSPFFFGELKLIFFVWLRFLPTSSRNEAAAKKYNSHIYQSSPLDIMYSRLAPLALHLVNSSSSVDLKQNSSFGFVASKAASFLDLAVLVRIISESSKQTIITVASESATLLPACITLFMPSTFTAYGCVYASAIIPAANSVNCETSINGKSRKRLLKGSPEYNQAKKDRIRYLKFWVVQSLILLLMDTFLASFLAWVPLSTHLTLLVWIWLNLPLGGTNIAYEFFEYELVAFGFLDSKDIQDYDVNKTLTVRLFKKISERIPVAKEVDGKGNQVAQEKNVDLSSPNTSSEKGSEEETKESQSERNSEAEQKIVTNPLQYEKGNESDQLDRKEKESNWQVKDLKNNDDVKNAIVKNIEHEQKADTFENRVDGEKNHNDQEDNIDN